MDGANGTRLLVATGNEFGYGGIEAFLISAFGEIDGAVEKRFYTPCRIAAREQGERMERAGFELLAGNRPPLGEDTPPLRHLAFYWRMARDLRKLLRAGACDVFYANPGNVLTGAVMALVARISGVPRRIVHAHNTAVKGSGPKELVRAICRWTMARCATERIGCSRDAAVYFFGRARGSAARVIHCGIDARGFAFRREDRDRIRAELGLGDHLVVGHIGRFEAQKNHDFLLRAFRELCGRAPSARLMLFGRGELEDRARALARELDIEDRVLFMGNSDRIRDYLCAMDVFVLPSLFEGLGIVNIEAQASGLPCVLSDAVPREAGVTELARFVSLDRPPAEWAEEIVRAAGDARSASREQAWERVVEAGFDVSRTRREVSEAIRGKPRAAEGEGCL